MRCGSITALLIAGTLAAGAAHAQERPADTRDEAVLQQAAVSIEDVRPATPSLAEAALPEQALFSQDASSASASAARRTPSGAGVMTVAVYSAYGVLQALDVHSTLKALEDNKGAEANPLVRTVVSSPGGLIAVKAATTVGFVYMVERIRKKNRTAAFVLAVTVSSLQAYVVAHNYRVANR